MEKQKLTKDKIASILNKYSFLGHSEWRFNYDDKVFSVYYADGYLDIDIARAIAKVYLRLEANKAWNKKQLEYLRGVDQGSKPFFINGKKLEGLAEGDKVLVMDFDDNKYLTAKEMAEGLVSMVKAASTAGNGMSYYLSNIKCTAVKHIVHSGYPLVPETLTCMLPADHTVQHCATDQNGNRINWS